MRISKCNGEGYYDPTSYVALSEIIKKEKSVKRTYRPLVYICSSFAGNTKDNVQKAKRYSRFAVENVCIPLAPNLLFSQFMDYTVPAERNLTMFMNIVLLGTCEQMWVFGNNISTGMAAEIDKAEKNNMQIRYFTENMKEIKRD